MGWNHSPGARFLRDSGIWGLHHLNPNLTFLVYLLSLKWDEWDKFQCVYKHGHVCVCVTERDGVCEYVSVYYSLSCKSALEF